MDLSISKILHRSFTKKGLVPVQFLNKLFPLWFTLFCLTNLDRLWHCVGLITIPIATKLIVRRQRPNNSHPHIFKSMTGTRYVGLDLYSFPSGHTTLYSFFCFYYWFPLWMWPIFAISSLARSCIGVHWFSDIAGGWIQGLLLSILFNMPIYSLINNVGTVIAALGFLWLEGSSWIMFP